MTEDKTQNNLDKAEPKKDDDFKDFQTTLWESHIKISDPESGEVYINQRD
jgi:hypothetical protein